MSDRVWAIEVAGRTISDAAQRKPFAVRWQYYRFRWTAKFVVWWINTLGAGRSYEFARGPWEAF